MKIGVVGVGHALGGDDFVGIRVVEELSEEIDEPEVEFITTMDPSRIVYLLGDTEYMVIVDAVFGDTAGEVHLIDHAEYPFNLKAISSHGIGVPLAIEMARSLGIDVEAKVRVVGISITEVRMYDDTLSEEVKKAIPVAKRMIMEIIKEFKGSKV
ncbi:MAG: hydrogenase maturation protease [Brevinematia bacterium]